ncbi:447_t:CDS:2 [Cetraspora pellucida]|uniref:447_t:CDS:1 n=1 Tax=Cetraspora pellucida TaxID=1433469 RepID=A0A9N9I0G1_9GLOM|nr:447_t:CDS:2 [Cetraspora pellucida]
MNELKHELFNLSSESDTSSSINHNNVTEVFTCKKVTHDGIDVASQHLAQLCNKAIDAEDRANRANQEEILCILYDSITEQLSLLRKRRSQELGLQLRDVSQNSLHKKTQRAEKNYKLFEKVGLNKIKYINSYSMNSISELTNAQFQEIIDYGISLEKLSIEADHVTKISETTCLGKTLPIPEEDSSFTPANAEINVAYDDVYFDDSDESIDSNHPIHDILLHEEIARLERISNSLGITIIGPGGFIFLVLGVGAIVISLGGIIIVSPGGDAIIGPGGFGGGFFITTHFFIPK